MRGGPFGTWHKWEKGDGLALLLYLVFIFGSCGLVSWLCGK